MNKSEVEQIVSWFQSRCGDTILNENYQTLHSELVSLLSDLYEPY